ncbi:hypothetical protein SCHPADRAFT_926149 [Schizopora paradoxa]|uniref:Uncharacterized protein n=1 Tax=Schizopora paradoxa TaxID=27342 RepID=A0A0H2RZL3_9AGAM|nr:hypothetical protein SCHPADRAFT_926149 [Schizopora paradoxa]
MILDKFLSKFTSFATYSDVAEPSPSPALEEDSETSVFSDDEEYEEKPHITHNSSQSNMASSAAKGKKRARPSEDGGDSLSNGDASTPESASKRAKLELETPSLSSAIDLKPAKREVRFHPDTLDNWRWADRDVYAIRAIRSGSPAPVASSSSSLPGPEPLPSIKIPLVATPNPKRLSSANLSKFLESDRDICGNFGDHLPPSEGPSYMDRPEYDSIRVNIGIESPSQSICGDDDTDSPCRSPSPDSRRRSWGGVRDGVWDDFDEEDDIQDMTLKGAPTPLSSPTLPSHPINGSASSSSASIPAKVTHQSGATNPSAALNPAELASIITQIRRLDSATQALIDKLAQHRCQEAWRAGFQVGIHTQLTAHAKAAAITEEARAKLLGLPAPKVIDADIHPVSGPSQDDLSILDEKILQSDKKKRKKGYRWAIIGKDELLARQRGWASTPKKVRAQNARTVPKPVVQEHLSESDGEFEYELPSPKIRRPTRRLPQ